MLNRTSPLAIALQRPLPQLTLSHQRFGDRRLYSVVKTERIRLDDIGAHVLVLSETKGSDLQLRNVVANHAVADLTAGNGQVVGYGTVTTPDGERLHYSFSGRVTTRPGPDGAPLTTTEGMWTLTGGTGRWQRRVAGGAFLDTVVGPGVSISDWSGTWETRPSSTPP